MSHYQNLPRTSDQQKERLIAEISPSQSGNDSRYKANFSKYSVSFSRLKQNAVFAGRGAGLAK